MKIIQFLARVLSKTETGYLIQVNKDVNKLPIGDVTNKLIQYTEELELGKVYYFYNATLEDSKVTVTSYTLLGEISESNQIIIPEEIQSKILDRNLNPCDL